VVGRDCRDAEAFRLLYRAYYGPVCRYLAVRAERPLVEDVAAETFLVAWRRQGEIPAHVLPWLLNVAGKCLANQRRAGARAKALRERLSDALGAGSGRTIEEDVLRREQCRALAGVLASLRERDRELLLLRYWDGLAPRDIARVLELSPVVARARLHRASARIRCTLADALEREPQEPHGTQRATEALELTEGVGNARQR
jgi:RNA polymerase sigma-70 factor (ECF subfamily)